MIYSGTISSDKGFYIGDICYVLSDRLYDNVWGGIHKYEDGKFDDPVTGWSFAVGSTAYGDGEYFGSDGFRYSVDAGVIGIVPFELVEKEPFDLGTFHKCKGAAVYILEMGMFTFKLPDGETIFINTLDEEEEEEWEDEYDG